MLYNVFKLKILDNFFLIEKYIIQIGLRDILAKNY